MKKHLSFEDLSSFVDGEHADMASVQKHLQQCEECARSHVDMTKMSSHVQALPEPEVSDAFARSVMRD